MNVQRPQEFENIPDFLFDMPNIIEDPREEHCCQSIVQTCCPNYIIKSFASIICITDILLFIIMGYYGGFTQINSDILQLQEKTMIVFGECDPYKIRYLYEYYRLFTSIFLHKDYLQLTTSVVAQLIICQFQCQSLGSIAENSCNAWKMGLIYISTGVAGNLGSIVQTDQVNSGPEQCIFGLLGAIFGFLVQTSTQVNKPIQQLQQTRQIILIILFYVLLNVIFGFFVPGMNNLGHLGSLGIGFIFANIIPANNRELFATKLKAVGIGIIFLYFTGCLYVFFSFRNPIQISI